MDVILVLNEGASDIYYDGMNPKLVHVECEDGTGYGKRPVDLLDTHEPYEPVNEDIPIL